jgi:hypothetical protein
MGCFALTREVSRNSDLIGVIEEVTECLIEFAKPIAVQDIDSCRSYLVAK